MRMPQSVRHYRKIRLFFMYVDSLAVFICLLFDKLCPYIMFALESENLWQMN